MNKEERVPLPAGDVRTLENLAPEGLEVFLEAGESGVLLCRDDSACLTLKLRGDLEIALHPGEILVLLESFTLQATGEGESPGSILVTLKGAGPPAGTGEGLIRLAESLWSRALFEALEALELEDLQSYCRMKVLEMFYLLERGSLAGSADRIAVGENRERFRLAQQADSWIRSHLGEDLSIDAICRAIHTSGTTLKKDYRAVYGIPIHQAVIRCRMEAAARLLLTTSCTVEQIALQVGYLSTSQFGVVFQRCYGMTPARFRRVKKV